jgi:FkbM family methyltransferase
MEDILIWAHRRLRPYVGLLGVSDFSRRVYGWLAAKRYGPDGLCVATQNGRTWRLRREVAERGAFQEFDTIAWLREVIRPGMTVIDIGANVGQMTLEMADLVGPRGRVVAIEPAPGNLACLRQHVEANGFSDRVHIVRAACSATDGGSVTLHVALDQATSSSLGSGHTIMGKPPLKTSFPGLRMTELAVPTVSVDQLCAMMKLEPSVIKIDVEGAELLVLEGARQTMRTHKPAVRVGFHPFAFVDAAAASASLVEMVGEVGYSVLGYAPGKSLSLEEYDLVQVPSR